MFSTPIKPISVLSRFPDAVWPFCPLLLPPFLPLCLIWGRIVELFWPEPISPRWGVLSKCLAYSKAASDPFVYSLLRHQYKTTCRLLANRIFKRHPLNSSSVRAANGTEAAKTTTTTTAAATNTDQSVTDKPADQWAPNITGGDGCWMQREEIRRPSFLLCDVKRYKEVNPTCESTSPGPSPNRLRNATYIVVDNGFWHECFNLITIICFVKVDNTGSSASPGALLCTWSLAMSAERIWCALLKKTKNAHRIYK